MSKKILSIVIVTYNSSKELDGCLDVLEGFNKDTVEILIIDNASLDNTVELLKKKQLQFPHFKMVFNTKNSGFSGGANQAFGLAESDVVLSINPDTTVTVDAVLKMLEYFNANPDIGILGPKITDEYGIFQETFGRDLTPLNELTGKIFQSKYMEKIPALKKWKTNKLNSPKTIEVGWIGGACFMMKKEVYLKTGGINQQFFLSHADLIDLSKRVHDLGLKNILYAPVSVIHTGGKSSVGDRDAALRTSFIGTLYYFKKYYGWPTVLCAKTVYVTVSSVKSVIAFTISLFKRNPYRDISKAHSKNVFRIVTGTLGSIKE